MRLSLVFFSGLSIYAHPLVFEQNQGQFRTPVAFVSRGPSYSLDLESRASVLRIGSQTVRTELLGANPRAKLSGRQPHPGTTTYLTGSSPAQWRSGVPNFGSVGANGIYPGIDLVYYGKDSKLEYDFVVAPGADPKRIRLSFTGQSNLHINGVGDLIIQAGAARITHKKPVAFQTIAGARRMIDAKYSLRAGNRIGFELGTYDRNQQLIIDPVLTFASYLGGARTDLGSAAAIDAAGNLYVTGNTSSSNFPISPGALKSTLGGTTDVYVAKFSPAGALLYSTFVGGNDGDLPRAITVDAAGNAAVTGITVSTDFPLVSPVQAAYRGGDLGFDAFVFRLNPTGSALLFSSYLGGNSDDIAMGIAVDNAGSLYVTGGTFSANFPTTPNALQPALRGVLDAFVTKLSPSGSSILFSTYLGGSQEEIAGGIAVDSGGNILVIGETASTDYPVSTNAYQARNRGGTALLSDAFVTKLNAAGQAIVYSTFIGGPGDDAARAVAVDAAGNAHVSGFTESVGFPVTPGVVQSELSGSRDAFAAKFGPAGAIVYSTLLGGGRSDRADQVSIDRDGNAIVGGDTTSSNFPVRNPSQAQSNGGVDAFVAQLNATGTALLNSTYFGGPGDDELFGLAVDRQGSVFVFGDTDSPSLPGTSASYQRSFNGGAADAFFAKIDFAAAPASLNVSPSSLTFTGAVESTIAPQSLTITATGANLMWSTETTTASGGNWLTVNPRSGTGSAAPSVRVNTAGLRADTYRGSITLTNITSNTTTQIPVTLTITAATSQIPANGVVNAASFQGGAVSPGLIVTIFGSGIGPEALVGLRVNSQGLVDTTLAETRVLFDGVPAPLIYVSARQVSAVVPYSVAGRATTQMTIEYRGQRTNTITLNVAPGAPGIFTANSSRTGPGAILNQDNLLNTASNPAARGSVIILYATGEGQTTPAGVDGAPATSVYPKPDLPVSVTIGGRPAEILYVGAAPNYVAGVMQINARVPLDVVPGEAVSVVVTVGNASSQNAVTVAVQ